MSLVKFTKSIMLIASFLALPVSAQFAGSEWQGGGGGGAGGASTSIVLGDSIFIQGTTQTVEFFYGVAVDLNMAEFVEPGLLQKFRPIEATSSHVTALGALPQTFVAYARDDTIVIHDARTGSEYVKFEGGTDNAVPSGCLPVDMVFKDFILYTVCDASGGGLLTFDFSNGRVTRITESGELVYGNGVRDGISERNSAGAYTNASAVGTRIWNLQDDTANSVAVARNYFPHMQNGWGRREHIIAVGSDAGLTILDPHLEGVSWDEVNNPNIDAVRMTPRGHLFAAGDDGVDVEIGLLKTAWGQVDDWAFDRMYDNDETVGYDLSISDAATFGDFDVAVGDNMPLLALGTSEGALLIRHSTGEIGGLEELQTQFKITGSANYPPWRNDEVNSYAFEATNPTDGGPAGEDFTTEVGDPTYGHGVVGLALHLDGDDGIEVTSDFDLDGGFYVAVWCSLTATAAEQTILEFEHTTAELIVALEATTGNLEITLDDGSGTNDNMNYGEDAGEGEIWGTSAAPLGGWHHIAVTKAFEGGGEYRLLVDGVQVDSIAVSQAADEFEITALHVGKNSSDANFMTGAVDELVFGVNAEIVEDEYIQLLFERGMSGGSLTVDTNDALSADAVTAIAAIPGVTAICAADSCTLVNDFGIPFDKLASPGGNIQAVQLMANFGGLPAVSIGATAGFRINVPAVTSGQAFSAVSVDEVPDFVKANPCVIDSSGVEGLFWDLGVSGQAPLVACERANIEVVEWRPGVYLDQAIISVSGMTLRGSGDETLCKNYTQAASTTQFTVSGSNNVLESFAVYEETNSNGGSGTGDAILISGASNLFLDVTVEQSDLDGFVITGRENVLRNCRILDSDQTAISMETGANRTMIQNVYVAPMTGTGTATGIVSFSGADSISIVGGYVGGETVGVLGSVTISAGSDQCLVTGVMMEYEFTDGGTGTSAAGNQSN